jgi:hypothetical protein
VPCAVTLAACPIVGSYFNRCPSSGICWTDPCRPDPGPTAFGCPTQNKTVCGVTVRVC